jgi:hypothetical protein
LIRKLVSFGLLVEGKAWKKALEEERKEGLGGKG